MPAARVLDRVRHHPRTGCPIALQEGGNLPGRRPPPSPDSASCRRAAVRVRSPGRSHVRRAGGCVHRTSTSARAASKSDTHRRRKDTIVDETQRTLNHNRDRVGPASRDRSPTASRSPRWNRHHRRFPVARLARTINTQPRSTHQTAARPPGRMAPDRDSL